MCEPITLAAAGTAMEAALFSIVPASWAGAAGITMPAMSLGTGLAAASGAISAYSAYSQGQYQADVAKQNQRIAMDQARQEREKAEQDAADHGSRVRQLMAQQRASGGASGVDVNTGTPLSILADTARLGSQDVTRIRQNADMDAYGYHQQAGMFSAEASNARMRGRNRAFATALTAGTTLADRLYR